MSPKKDNTPYAIACEASAELADIGSKISALTAKRAALNIDNAKPVGPQVRDNAAEESRIDSELALLERAKAVLEAGAPSLWNDAASSMRGTASALRGQAESLYVQGKSIAFDILGLISPSENGWAWPVINGMIGVAESLALLSDINNLAQTGNENTTPARAGFARNVDAFAKVFPARVEAVREKLAVLQAVSDGIKGVLGTSATQEAPEAVAAT